MLYASVLPPFWLFMILTTSCPCSLALSLSPDLSCFQLANPPPQCNTTQHLLGFTLFSKHTPTGKGKASGPLGGGEQANSFLYYEKKKLLSKKRRGRGVECPKVPPDPPKDAAARSGGHPTGSRAHGGNFCAKFGPFEAGGEFILIFSLIFRHRGL